jgi:hypothetical protein
VNKRSEPKRPTGGVTMSFDVGATIPGQLLEIEVGVPTQWQQVSQDLKKKRHFLLDGSKLRLFGKRGVTAKATIDMHECLSAHPSADATAPAGSIELTFRAGLYVIAPDHSAAELLTKLRAAITHGTGLRPAADPPLPSRFAGDLRQPLLTDQPTSSSDHQPTRPSVGGPNLALLSAKGSTLALQSSDQPASSATNTSGRSSVTHSLLRKHAIATGQPTDFAGSFTAEVDLDFDLDRTIFAALPRRTFRRMMQRSRLDVRLNWNAEAEAEINEVFAAIPRPLEDLTPLCACDWIRTGSALRPDGIQGLMGSWA